MPIAPIRAIQHRRRARPRLGLTSPAIALRRAHTGGLFLLALSLAGCGLFRDEDAYSAAEPARLDRIQLVATQSVPEVGTGQGVHVRDGMVYLFGDAETGIIIECEQSWPDPPRLEPTGRTIRLTRGGEDIIPRPTGLTHHPDHGTFIGAAGEGGTAGEIYHIDFERALADGNLDNAVLNRTIDDAASGGTCPEFVQFRGDPYIATADNAPRGARLRLYDPARLAEAERTSAEGVAVRALPCPPWVQSLHWLEDRYTLVLVRNQSEGLGYRLSFARLEEAETLRGAPRLDLPRPEDELKSVAMLESNRGLLLSASARRNVRFALVRFLDESVD